MEDLEVNMEEQAIFAATSTLNDLLRNLGEARPTTNLELARTAALILNVLARQDQVEEWFNDLTNNLGDAAIGHFVLQALCEGPLDILMKGRLLSVADVLGPDHLDGLRRNVAFMIKVEGFN